MTGSPRIDAASLTEWVDSLLRSWGYRAADAARLADSLVDANLRGVDSHGVIRLPIYRRRVAEALVDPGATPIVTVRGGTVNVDANGAPGQVAAWAALEALVDPARTNGIAQALVRGSTHFGTAGYYARELARRGFIGIVASNSEPIVVPHGGAGALLGTNPLALSAPTAGDPITLDMATSTTAMGRVDLAKQRGQQIPGDWGVDAAGKPTTDPAEVVALLPMSGPKGYALAMFVEILAGVLTGAAVGPDIGHQYRDFSKPQDVGHWMVAIDIAGAMPVAAFTERIERLAALAHGVPPTDPERPVLLPGEPEERQRLSRLADGIPLEQATVDDLTGLGTECRVPFPAHALTETEGTE